MKEPIKEGFWTDGSGNNYPMPKENSECWIGQSKFLRKLECVEEKAEEVLYRGYSVCRICKKLNGIAEYTFNNFTWPSGFKHYVEKHNVKPSADFIHMVSSHNE